MNCSREKLPPTVAGQRLARPASWPRPARPRAGSARGPAARPASAPAAGPGRRRPGAARTGPAPAPRPGRSPARWAALMRPPGSPARTPGSPGRGPRSPSEPCRRSRRSRRPSPGSPGRSPARAVGRSAAAGGGARPVVHGGDVAAVVPVPSAAYAYAGGAEHAEGERAAEAGELGASGQCHGQLLVAGTVLGDRPVRGSGHPDRPARPSKRGGAENGRKPERKGAESDGRGYPPAGRTVVACDCWWWRTRPTWSPRCGSGWAAPATPWTPR